MTAQAERLSIVSAERIREELMKIVMSPDPRRGLALLVDTGLAEYVLPELPLLRLEEDEHHHHKDVYEHTLTVLEQAMVLEQAHEPASGPDPVLRLAALLHDIGKPRTRRFEPDGRVSFHHHEVVGARMTRKRMQQLRFSNDMIDDVSTLVELHLRFHGYGTGEWTDSAVRRYVRDAGPLLARLHKLTRADSTTRNRRRALALQRSYDSLEQRIAELTAEEEMNAIRPDLDGRAIMAILGVPPGPVVGRGVPVPARPAAGPRTDGCRRRRGGPARVVGGPSLGRVAETCPNREHAQRVVPVRAGLGGSSGGGGQPRQAVQRGHVGGGRLGGRDVGVDPRVARVPGAERRGEGRVVHGVLSRVRWISPHLMSSQRWFRAGQCPMNVRYRSHEGRNVCA